MAVAGAVIRVIGGAETQRIKQRHRAGAHRQNIAHNAADAGSRPLKRLHRRRVVMRLHLEHHRQPVAKIHRAGVFRPGRRQHRADAGRLAGMPEHPQQRPRMLIAAMLAPQSPEHPQLHPVRLAAEALHNQIILGAGKGDFIQNFLADGHSSPAGARRISPRRRPKRAAIPAPRNCAGCKAELPPAAGQRYCMRRKR